MEENKTNQIDEGYDNLFSAYFDEIRSMQANSSAARYVALGRLESLVGDLKKIDSGTLISASDYVVYIPLDLESHKLLVENLDLDAAKVIRRGIGSQDEVGRSIGISGKYVSAIETGRKEVKDTDACRRYTQFLVNNGYEDN